MRRRRSSNTSMSLFPFLDTLVCTMGALILMLLAMTPKIKERALARQAAAQDAEVEETPALEPAPALPTGPSDEEIAAEKQRRHQAWLAQLAEARRALQEKQTSLQSQRQLLRDADQHLQELTKQIEKSRQAVSHAAVELDALDERSEKIEAQSAVVSQNIAATRKEIDLANRRQAIAKNEFALVAYDGASGTTRRPISIECTGDGFRFLPEDVFVDAIDLTGFTPVFNPLLLATQALVQHWNQVERRKGTRAADPYVLLLVRPSGTMNYYHARAFLATLGVRWGYELIEEEWKLSTANADKDAKDLLVEALAASKQMQRSSRRDVASLERRYGGVFDPNELFGGDTAGNSAGRESRSNSNAGNSARSTGSTGMGVTGNSSAPSSGSRSSDNRSAASLGGSGKSGGSSKSSTIGDSLALDSADNSEEISPRNNPTAFSGRSASRSSGASSGFGGPRNSGTAIEDPTDSKVGGFDSDIEANGEASGRGKSIDGHSASRGGGFNPQRGSAQPATMGGIPSIRSPGAADGDGTGVADRPSRFALPDDEDSGSTSGEGDETLREPRRLGDHSASGTSKNRNGYAGEQGTQANADADENDETTVTGEGTGTKAGRSGTTANNPNGRAGSKPSWLADSDDTGDANAPMGGPGATLNLGLTKKRKSKSDDSDNQPRIADDSPKNSGGGRSERANGPRKWGQTGRRAGIGFEKVVKVYLNDKRVVVHSKQYNMLITPDQKAEEITNRVASALEQVAESWGQPPDGFHWVPVVRFVVYPGGDPIYARLKSDLETKWGLTTSFEYASQTPPAKTTPAAKTGGEK